MRIDYNSPVVLTFTIASVLIFILTANYFPDLTVNYFVLRSPFFINDPTDWFRLVSYVLGHASFEHLLNNIFIILLLGPILEEKYGSTRMFWMMVMTAGVTGLINVIFFSTGLLGASGIAFSYIVLVSIVNVKRRTVPLSFVLVFLIFVGGEITRMFEPDNISQMGHIVGGLIGAFVGFDFAESSHEYKVW